MDLQFVKKENASEMPTVLYKYRTWIKPEHKRLLTHHEIYYASPDELDELTECNLGRDYDSVTKEMIWEFCRQEAQREVDAGIVEISFVLNRTKELFETNKFYDLEHRAHAEKEFRAHLNNVLSIFCASETPMNERLWNTFAGYKTGYCVGIDFTEIYTNDTVFGTCGKVNYYQESDHPKIPPISLSSDERVLNMMKLMYNLPDKFREEDEFRFTKMHINNRRVPLNPDWIKEVILGSEMEPTAEAEIVALVTKTYPSAKIKKLFVEPTFNQMSIIDYN
ncbi:MAG TPA: hypothetical protein VL021_04140 [Brumimicrobium sp.]|nr:hypothetical protein [Brumimicrobium sp.]